MSGEIEKKKAEVERDTWVRPELRRLDAADAQATGTGGFDSNGGTTPTS